METSRLASNRRAFTFPIKRSPPRRALSLMTKGLPNGISRKTRTIRVVASRTLDITLSRRFPLFYPWKSREINSFHASLYFRSAILPDARASLLRPADWWLLFNTLLRVPTTLFLFKMFAQDVRMFARGFECLSKIVETIRRRWKWKFV